MAISVYVYSIITIIDIVNTVASVDYRNQFPDIPCGEPDMLWTLYSRMRLERFQWPLQMRGWIYGTNLYKDENECTQGHPCINRGHCINTIGSFSCNCLIGWTGDHCQFGTGDPQECMPGWTLPRCTHDLDECANTSLYTCPENQHCHNTHGNYTCDCNAGWKGLGCQEDIDECEVDICKNNGTCVNTPGSFICQCQEGWQGNHCVEDVDECIVSKCKNNGSCINTNGSFMCQCQLGWQGLNCKNDVNECFARPCNNNETCINTGGSFRCQLYDSLQGYVNKDEIVVDFNDKLNMTDKGVSFVPVDELPNNETNAVSRTPTNEDSALFKNDIRIALISAGSVFGVITLMVGIRIAYITFKSGRVVPTDAVRHC